MPDRPVPCAPPDAIVDASGHIALGVYDRPFRKANLADASLSLGPIPLGRTASRLRLKEWQHFAIVLPEAMLTFAIVDAKVLGASWCHFVNRDGTGQFEHEHKGPLLNVRVARDLWDDETYVRTHRYRIQVRNHLDAGEHRIRIFIRGHGGAPSIEADLRCLHDLERITPLEVVLPVGPGRAMYSHKVPLPVEGTVTVGHRVLEAKPGEARAILDVHKAHYPRHTWWNWATFVGRDDTGRSIGLNLTSNVNRRDEQFNENAVWLDGRMEMLAPARFELNPNQPLEPWRIRTVDDAVDLVFRPLGERSEDLHVGLLRSVFHQPFGTFSGTIRTVGGTVHVTDTWGICEDHDAIW
jgi:hypothetical protein